jgi:hypothetical protein
MNQIYHVLIQKHHFSNLRDVRCKRGVNVDSEHHLVVVEIHARISTNRIQRGKVCGNIMFRPWKVTRCNRHSGIKS